MQDIWTTHIKHNGEYLGQIKAKANENHFTGIIFRGRVGRSGAKGDTVEEVCKGLKNVLNKLSRKQMTDKQKDGVREDLNHLISEYGEMTPDKYIKTKVDEMMYYDT